MRWEQVNRFFRGFSYALRGVLVGIRTEQNVRFHLCAAGYVLAYAGCVHLPAVRLAAALTLIGLVISLELVNTAIERLCDARSTAYNEKIGEIKDLAAGAVLVSAMAAGAAGVCLLGAYLPAFFGLLADRLYVAVLWLVSLPVALIFIFHQRSLT